MVCCPGASVEMGNVAMPPVAVAVREAVPRIVWPSENVITAAPGLNAWERVAVKLILAGKFGGLAGFTFDVRASTVPLATVWTKTGDVGLGALFRSPP
jgi:hypothetical protein